MADFTPVWPRFGNDGQGTQRTTTSLDLDNLNLFFSYTFSYPIYSGDDTNGGYWGTSGAPIVLATYDGEEYAYLGTSSRNSVSVPSKLFSVKTKLGETFPVYNIISTELLSSTSTNNHIRSSIVTSLTGKTYVIAHCPSRAASNYELFRIAPPPSTVIPLTNGTLAAFTNSSFTANGGFLPDIASQGNIISINGTCYVFHRYLDSFDPDDVTAGPIVRSASLNSGAYYTHMVYDPTGVAGDHSIYISSAQYNYLFRTSDISNPILINGLSVRDTNQYTYWGSLYAMSGGMVFKDAVNPLDKRLYITQPSYSNPSGGLVSYDKDFMAIDCLAQSDSTHVFSGPALGLDGTIYYRAGTKLYAIEDSGSLLNQSEIVPNGSLSLKYTYDLLPDDVDANGQRSTATPIIDGSGRIIVCSNSVAAGDNVHILRDTGSALVCDKSFRVGGRIQTTPSIGSTGLLYILAGQTLYVYGETFPPTTTTTTTTFAPTTTTTTTGTGTTTTTGTTTATTTPTTTTTTTTPSRGIEQPTMAVSQQDGKFMIAEYTKDIFIGSPVSSEVTISGSSVGNSFSIVYEENLGTPAGNILYSECNDKVYISTKDNNYIYAVDNYLTQSNSGGSSSGSNSSGSDSVVTVLKSEVRRLISKPNAEDNDLIVAYKCDNDSIWSVQAYNNKVVKMNPVTFAIIQEYNNLDAPIKIRYSKYHGTYFVAGSHILWQINDSLNTVTMVYQVNDYVIMDMDLDENGNICLLLYGDVDGYIRILNKNLYRFLLNEKITGENLRYCKYCQEGRFYVLTELDTITTVYTTAHYLFDVNTSNLKRILTNSDAITTTTTTTLENTENAVKMVDPNGGEQVEIGKKYDIKWISSKSASDLVNIDLYKEDIFYSTVAEKTQNSGVYGWDVTADIKEDTNYKIKVTWISSDKNNYGVSDEFFSITQNPTTTTTTTTEAKITQSAIAVDYSAILNEVVILLRSGRVMSFDLKTLVASGLADVGISDASTMTLNDVVIKGIDRQIAVRIWVGSQPNLSDKWDSGEIVTPLTSMYYGGGNNLRSGETYWVNIQTCSQLNGWGNVQTSSFVMPK